MNVRNRIKVFIWVYICFYLPLLVFGAPMKWTEKTLPFSLKDKMKEYNVMVWRGSGSTEKITSDDDVIYVTSSNIRMKCSPLASDFAKYSKDDNSKLTAQLNSVRRAKEKDDAISYGLDIAKMVKKSRDAKYFGCEQHVVCAVIASARTGFHIAPEFWLETDAYAGTAGNGPNVEDEGDYGEKRSTIAMAHDPDWILGRYFGAGPLTPLSTVPHGHDGYKYHKYQLGRMGCFGLMNGGAAQNLFFAGWCRGKEAEVNDYNARHLDKLAKHDNYTDWEVINQGKHGWETRFKRSYMRGSHYRDDEKKKTAWDGKEPSNAKVIDIFKLPQLRAKH